MEHPGKILLEQIRDRGWTQKQFSSFVGKKNSEVNELIKGKRNITVQWDLILSEILGTPEKYWINMQVDYDYDLAKKMLAEERSNSVSEGPEIVGPDGKPEKQESENPEPEVPETPALGVDSTSGAEDEGNEKKPNSSDNSFEKGAQDSSLSSEGEESQKGPKIVVNNGVEKIKSLQKIFLNF